MILQRINVVKSDVYDEVAKTTAYEGSKLTGDNSDGAYDRIFTTEGDRAMLGRFWDEACNVATDTLKRYIQEVNSQADGENQKNVDGYHVELMLSTAYDTRLTSSMEKSLRSFFVNSIVAKWDKFANKGNVETYEKDASSALEDIMSKIYYRKKPTRVTPK